MYSVYVLIKYYFILCIFILVDTFCLTKESRNRPGVAQSVPGGLGS